MIPDNVEKIIMTKEDYDRNVEQLLVEKLNLEQELQRKDNIINEVTKALKELIKPRRGDNSFHRNPVYVIEIGNLLTILGKK